MSRLEANPCHSRVSKATTRSRTHLVNAKHLHNPLFKLTTGQWARLACTLARLHAVTFNLLWVWLKCGPHT